MPMFTNGHCRLSERIATGLYTVTHERMRTLSSIFQRCWIETFIVYHRNLKHSKKNFINKQQTLVEDRNYGEVKV